MGRVLIHIGYYKTGSKWLQNSVFFKCAGLQPLAKQYRIFQTIIQPNSLDFQAGEVQNLFRNDLESIHAAGKIAVVSSERLSGSPHSGGRDSREIADRLACVFPEAKILIVIRDQMAAIAASYKQLIRGGGAASVRRYLCPPESADYTWFDAQHFRYEPLIRYYIALFGRPNVHVALYEKLQADNREFCREVLEFAGLTTAFELPEPARVINRSLSDVATRWLCMINRFGGSHLRPYPLLAFPRLKRVATRVVHTLDQHLPRSNSAGRISREVRRLCAGKFAESNRKLEALLRVDLRSLGYE